MKWRRTAPALPRPRSLGRGARRWPSTPVPARRVRLRPALPPSVRATISPYSWSPARIDWRIPGVVDKIDVGHRVGRDDDCRSSVGIDHGNGARQELVQRCRDLGRATSGERDAGEALVDVEDAFQSLPLRLEQRVEDGRRHVGERGPFRKGDHRKRQPVRRSQHLFRELVGGVEADRDPGDAAPRRGERRVDPTPRRLP